MEQNVARHSPPMILGRHSGFKFSLDVSDLLYRVEGPTDKQSQYKSCSNSMLIYGIPPLYALEQLQPPTRDISSPKLFTHKLFINHHHISPSLATIPQLIHLPIHTLHPSTSPKRPPSTTSSSQPDPPPPSPPSTPSPPPPPPPPQYSPTSTPPSDTS